MKKISIISVAFLLLASFAAKAEENLDKYTYRIKLGENIGGTLPIPFPAEIRKIVSFSPIFSPYVSVEGTKWFSRNWGITAGLALDVKGMKAGADVLYFNTVLAIGNEGSFEGAYSGYCLMKPKNIYVTVPFQAAYRFNNKWDIGFGGYFSVLGKGGFAGIVEGGYMRSTPPNSTQPNSLGEIMDITTATFDFAEEIQKIDVGLMVSGNYTFWRNFGAFAHFSFGLIPIFPKDFHGVSDYRMTNTYGCLGLSYKL